MSDPYQEWKQRVKEGIYAAAFARMALEHCSDRGEHKIDQISDDDIEAFAEKAGELAERWESTRAP